MALLGKLFSRNSGIARRSFSFLQPTTTLSVKVDVKMSTPAQCDEMDDAGRSTSILDITEMNIRSPQIKTISCPIRNGMKILDRSAFTHQVLVPSVLLPEEHFIRLVKPLKPYLLKIRQVKPTFPQDEDGKRRILLDPDLVTDLKEFLRSFPKEQLISEEIIEAASMYPLTLTYENWSHVQITNSILPDDDDKFSGFSQVGSLIHVNLRDHLLPYKNIIGQVLLDKISKTKTVVNKLNSIETEFRTFQMEVIAGESNTVVKVKENQCEFEFDFATVYWNSRLSSEHERIPKKYMKNGDILFDVFAGVGPFTIPAAKKKCMVLANDLNPESAKWLERNIANNKVEKYVQVFNKDGRHFIRDDVASYLMTKLTEGDINFGFHVTMNLPAIAVDFLDAFWNLFEGKTVTIPSDFKLVVHVYCFIKDIEEFKEKALALVKEKLHFDLPDLNVLEVFYVRNVAPNKEMMCVSFAMPHGILQNKCPVPSTSTTAKRKFDEIEGN